MYPVSDKRASRKLAPYLALGYRATHFSGHLASVVRKSVEESSVRFLRRRFEQQPLPPPHPKPLSTSSSQPVPLRSLDVSLGFELARWSTRCPPPQPLRRSRGEALWPCSLLASLSPSCAARNDAAKRNLVHLRRLSRRDEKSKELRSVEVPVVPIHELPTRGLLGNSEGIRRAGTVRPRPLLPLCECF
jgi:hypothetical protein